jgi:hypothetical protein
VSEEGEEKVTVVSETMPSKAPDPMDTTLEGMVTVCRPEEAKALLLMFTRVWAEVRGKDPRDAVLAKA